ncbi:leucyl aminopeptidase family protein [Mesorhizobium sp. YIM 152430]|uniref:leucyl aminopeptidase family protein n=1 Tax=Mesorhizobium sp. YIM 152430 TaxID=3031761 RepID=UPI0023DC7906|nr:leucyl aminopeptidase family protein [Mesorhizobium sp. YIM 152430]MDF1598847.1 leucyl aminopeptidase family protein [Mesorhizobium sp. YIM 152430]
MPIEITETPLASARPIHVVTEGGIDAAAIDARARAWAKASGFSGQSGKVLAFPDADGGIAGALAGIGKDEGPTAALALGRLARDLPSGEWAFAPGAFDAHLATLALVLGGYRFERYWKDSARDIRLQLSPNVDLARITREAQAVILARDLINTPTNDMGPADLEQAARKLAKAHKARITVVEGDALLKRNFPMIHAVGRASAEAPRLIDLTWGAKDAPKVTLVGKGVCFDTGGLDIKPASGMLLMKKDMGGAANVLGLALMIMSAKLNLRLRVLIPAVENAISGNAFRPGDVLTSRRGLTVEIGNTDAEGRLILADALALADEEKPELLIDMATLTGAARVALGPDLPPFFTDDEALAAELSRAGETVADPVWRMPLWKPYAKKLSSRVADMNNVTTDGFAGSVTAALFLQKFVENARSWVHLDIFGWNPVEKPHAPVGGEAQAIRALMHVLEARYGK